MEKCKTCKHCELYYHTEDEKEINEINEKEIIKRKELYYTVTKDMLKKGKIDKLLKYIKEIDMDNMSWSEWNDGFLREPKNTEEIGKSQYYCMRDFFEPVEIEEMGEDDCDEYIRKKLLGEE